VTFTSHFGIFSRGHPEICQLQPMLQFVNQQHEGGALDTIAFSLSHLFGLKRWETFGLILDVLRSN
jgi:hypothetical protein